jgi:hypothetical protein
MQLDSRQKNIFDGEDMFQEVSRHFGIDHLQGLANNPESGFELGARISGPYFGNSLPYIES